MNNTVSIGEPWMWFAFVIFVLAMLALDLFVLGGNKAHKVSVKEAAAWSLADNSQFEAMRSFYQANDLFRVPSVISSYNYVIDKNAKVIVHCKMGGRSAKAVQFLREKGYDATNVTGGINAWSESIDPSVPQY